MEKIADQIESLLTEKCDTYRDLAELFKKERKAIIDMDVASIWEAATRKKQIGKKIQTLCTSINHSMEQISLSPVLTIKRTVFSNLKLAIDREKAEVARLASENKKYVQERLEIIEDLVATILPSSEPDRYGWTGSVLLPMKSNCFINKEV